MRLRVSAKGIVIGDVIERHGYVVAVEYMDIGMVRVEFADGHVETYRASETLIVDDGIDRTSPGRRA